jgi:acyl transferase domain-containing protein
MPDAPNAKIFWENIKNGRYSISDVTRPSGNPELYYDPDPKAPDKSYSKIGGWVREWNWDPRAWKLSLVPKVAEAMDDTQKWAVACTHQALTDYGYPTPPLDTDRVAVVLGNAMAGERHYQTSLRISYREIAEELGEASSFHGLANEVQSNLLAESRTIFAKRYPEITEDTMPGELSNCIAGRVANLFNFRGPNFVIDAACASAMAANPGRLRRRHRRWHRPQHGRSDVRRVLQHRCLVGHRNPALR